MMGQKGKSSVSMSFAQLLVKNEYMKSQMGLGLGNYYDKIILITHTPTHILRESEEKDNKRKGFMKT